MPTSDPLSKILRSLPLALGASLLLCSQVEAQVADLDEGSFEITVDGAVVGTEEFAIRRIGLGATASIVLQGTTRVGGSEIDPILETSPEWVPLEYRRTVTGERDEVVQLFVDGARYTAVTTNPSGEGEREFRPGEFNVILDAEIAFLYHAVAARPDAGIVTVIHPDLGRQLRMRLEVVGAESFQLGSRSVPVRRLRLSSGSDLRDVLVDDQNRVMSVEIPARSWVARRLPE